MAEITKDDVVKFIENMSGTVNAVTAGTIYAIRT